MAVALSSPRFARRSPLLGLIILMHAAFFYFVNAGMRIELPIFAKPLELLALPETKQPVEPLKMPPAEPLLQSNPLDLAPLELPPIESDMDDPPPQVVITDDVVGITDGYVQSGSSTTLPTLDPRRPIGKPPYPAQAVRMGHEGLVRIQACVQADGRLTDVALAASSGHPALDEAALRHLRKPGIRLRPGTRDGSATVMCTTLPMRFAIADR